MSEIFVLDVPEFRPLVDAARKYPKYTITQSGEYFSIRGDGEIIINRKDVMMDEAVWYGALIGGFQGHIDSFTSDVIHIID